ncbi:unnamed protein product [Trichogramma brassicae]|uniref:Uncharacterized protein n=1 Tax=Trichogramma brassicae TaxID=86971 RepID=A0A6H5I2S7_9HYME|nr:unnamed protein product [Trichogramma brassicae]
MRVSNLLLQPMQWCTSVHDSVQATANNGGLFAHVSPSAAAKLEQPWYPYNVANKKTIAMIYIYECPPFNSFCSYITRDDAPSEEKTTTTTQVSCVLDVLRAVMCALCSMASHGYRSARRPSEARARGSRDTREIPPQLLSRSLILYVYLKNEPLLCRCPVIFDAHGMPDLHAYILVKILNISWLVLSQIKSFLTWKRRVREKNLLLPLLVLCALLVHRAAYEMVYKREREKEAADVPPLPRKFVGSRARTSSSRALSDPPAAAALFREQHPFVTCDSSLVCVCVYKAASSFSVHRPPYIVIMLAAARLYICEYGDELARASKPFEAVRVFGLQVYTFQNLKNTDSSGPQRCRAWIRLARAHIIRERARAHGRECSLSTMMQAISCFGAAMRSRCASNIIENLLKHPMTRLECLNVTHRAPSSASSARIHEMPCCSVNRHPTVSHPQKKIRIHHSIK